MNELQVTAHLKIHPGKLDEFKTLAAECMNCVREKDTGTCNTIGSSTKIKANARFASATGIRML